MKRLTTRQREVLASLSRRDGQPTFWLATGRSGNVLENLLGLGLIRIDCSGDGCRAFTTVQGREALRTGKVTT